MYTATVGCLECVLVLVSSTLLLQSRIMCMCGKFRQESVWGLWNACVCVPYAGKTMYPPLPSPFTALFGRMCTSPINTSYQHTMSTHPINSSYQHIISTHAINTSSQQTLPTLSTHPTNPSSQSTLSTHLCRLLHALVTSSRYIPGTLWQSPPLTASPASPTMECASFGKSRQVTD